MANRYKIGVGDQVAIQTDQGIRNFRVAAVTVDFDVNPTAFIFDPVYRKWWNDKEITALALFVAPGVDVDEKAQEIRKATAGQIDLLVRSNRGMRNEALVVFDRTFAITVALQLLATLVAFIGILSTLMSLQLERRREIGVLRATGMTRRQLWRLSLYETGLIGAVAGLIAMPVGLSAGDHPDLHHQPALLWLDAGDSRCSPGIYAGVLVALARHCWRASTRLEDGADAACDCGEIGVKSLSVA
jgi:putative ABC transport system permease protein